MCKINQTFNSQNIAIFQPYTSFGFEYLSYRKLEMHGWVLNTVATVLTKYSFIGSISPHRNITFVRNNICKYDILKKRQLFV